MLDDDTVAIDDTAPMVEQARRVKSSSLLWFISSRPYVPMADVRRRFGLQTDCGTLLFDEEGSIHIGLPRQAAETLLDLKRKQKIGFQYDLEYATRIAVGTYPIRIRLAPPPPSIGRPMSMPVVQEQQRVESEPLEEASEGLVTLPSTEPGPVQHLSPGQRRRRRR